MFLLTPIKPTSYRQWIFFLEITLPLVRKSTNNRLNFFFFFFPKQFQGKGRGEENKHKRAGPLPLEFHLGSVDGSCK